MSDTAYTTGTLVRVNEKRDKHNGEEGRVIGRMDDTIKTRYRALVSFGPTGQARWYDDSDLLPVDETENPTA
jgi:hypothetical protein